MSMSKLLITLGLILLMTTPIAVAHANSYSGSGTAVISDAGALSDRVTFSLTGVTTLPRGSAYEGWLVNSDSGDRISVGVMMAAMGNINHTWDAPEGANLIAGYDTASITVEPVPDDDPGPSDVTAFSDTVASGAMAHIRHLIVASPDSDSGFLSQLEAQVDMAMAKIDEAHAADDIEALKASLEEAVAIIDAEDGILALAATTEHASLAAEAAPDEASVGSYAREVIASGNNVASWSTSAKEDAAAVIAEDNLDTAKTLLNIVKGKIMAAKNGIDAANMGGASDAYQQAQRMATFSLPSAPAAAQTPSVGDTYVPAAMQVMLVLALILLIGGGALLYRERKVGAKA